MFILYAVVLGIIVGYIRGGRLWGLVNNPLKGNWLALAAILIQLVIFSSIPYVNDLPEITVITLHYFTYLLLLVFIIVNVKRWSIGIIGLGVFLNFLVIALNGGYMPTPADNFKGVQQVGEVNNNTMVAGQDTLFPWLGDIFHTPAWLPLANAFSIGDILIAIGVFIYIVLGMKIARKAVTLSNLKRW